MTSGTPWLTSERRADRREKLADAREDLADAREHRLDAAQARLNASARRVGVAVAGAREADQETLARARDAVSASRDRIDRSEDLLRRSAARNVREQQIIDREPSSAGYGSARRRRPARCRSSLSERLRLVYLRGARRRLCCGWRDAQAGVLLVRS